MNAEDRDWDSLSTLWRAPGDAIDRTPLEWSSFPTAAALRRSLRAKP